MYDFILYMQTRDTLYTFFFYFGSTDICNVLQVSNIKRRLNKCVKKKYKQIVVVLK